MPGFTRREFVAAAAAMGATLAWGAPRPTRSRTRWVERRDLFAAGRRVRRSGPRQRAPVDARVRRRSARRRPADGRSGRGRGVRARGRHARRRARSRPRTTPAACSSAGSSRRDRTGIASPTRTANGSRIGRTRHRARGATIRAPVAFAFVSCQNVMRRRAERLPPDDLRGRARGARGAARASSCTWATSSTKWSSTPRTGRRRRYDRRLRDIVRFPDGEKVSATSTSRHASTTIARSIAPTCTTRTCRTRAPAGRSLPCGTTTSSRGMGWQSRAVLRRRRPARRRPARSPPTRPGSSTSRRASASRAAQSLERFDAPAVKDAPIDALRRRTASARSRTTSRPSAA